jgi:fructose transport system ATP-binding protein
VDQEGEGMTTEASLDKDPKATAVREPVLQARGIIKRYGPVTAIASGDLELYPGEILAVIGDNGAGKTSLIKALCGALVPDSGEILLDGKVVHFKNPMDARMAGIETVYQSLAVSPGLDIADNLFLGREVRKPGPLGSVFRMLDKKHMRSEAKRHMSELGVATLQNIGQAVESLSGGQRQAVAVARSAAFGSKVVILDEPTAALGVKEGNRVLQLIRDVRDRGLPVILISHNMPHVFEVADRIHIHRLGKRIAVVTPKTHTMNEVVAIMTGAQDPDAAESARVIEQAKREDVAHH